MAFMAALAIIPWVVVWALAQRLRRRPDPESCEDICEPLGESAGYLESFDGNRLYVEEIGRGPTLVLVHGWFCNTDNWHYQKKLLSGEYRIISYDQRGHCWSEGGDGTAISVETLGLDLKSLLDSKAPGEPVVLVGHSMGGISILKYLEMFPEVLGERVKGIALVDTSSSPISSCMTGGSIIGSVRKPVVEPLMKWVVEHHGFADRVKGAVVRTSAFLVATRYLGYGGHASLTHMEYIGRMATMSSMRGVCNAALGLLSWDRPISLDQIRRSGIPVVIWVGEKDKLTRPEISIDMHREIPGSRLYVVEDTGHPSYMEEYVIFNDVLRELCQEAFSEGETK